MKKILLAMFLLFLAVSTSNAQLQITEYGEAYTQQEYKERACSIYWIEDGYYFAAWDYECALYNLVGDQYCVLIYLGKTTEEVEQSKYILENWFNTAINESYIYVTNPNGQRVCIYKYNMNIYCSYGSELDCINTRKKYTSSLTSMITGGLLTVLTGVDYTASLAYDYEVGRKELLANIEFGEHWLASGVSFKKELMHSFDNFLNEEDDSKLRFLTDGYTKKIIYKVGKVRELYKKNNLLESCAYTTFYAIYNPYMNSQNHKDWLKMERASEVLLHLMGKEPQFQRAILERELSAALTIEEKENIFDRYYRLIMKGK